MNKYFKLPSFFLFILFLFLSSFSKAQSRITSRKTALKIQQRILLVEIPSKPWIKSKDQDFIKNIVKKYWTFHKNVEYVPANQVRSKMKENKGKYALLRFDTKRSIRRVSKITTTTGKFENYKSFIVPALMLSLKPKSAQMKVNLSGLYSLERNVVFGLMHLQYLLKYLVANPKHKSLLTFYKKHVNRNASELKNKTLLIEKDFSGISLDKVKKYYPFPYKVVSFEEVENAIKEQKPDNVFVETVIFDTGQFFLKFISGTKDGKIYLYLTDSDYKFNRKMFQNMTKIIKKDD